MPRTRVTHIAALGVSAVILLVIPGFALAGDACPRGSRRATWSETLFDVSASAKGCVGSDGKRNGPFVATDARGREVLRGAYKDGLRDGAWTIHLFYDGRGKPFSSRMRLWFDEGVNRAAEGGRLTALALARSAVPVTPPQEEDRSEIHSLAIERLRTAFCDDDCLSYSVEIDRDGRVEYTGYRDTDLLGPHCGRLSPRYARAILSVAERANLKGLADSYRVLATDQQHLVVLAKWIATEKLISADGAPPVLYDLATLTELAVQQVHWGCKQEPLDTGPWTYP